MQSTLRLRRQAALLAACLCACACVSVLLLHSGSGPAALLSPVPRAPGLAGAYAYPGYGSYPGYGYWPGYQYGREVPEDYEEAYAYPYDAEAYNDATHAAYVTDYYARNGVPPGPTISDNFEGYYSPYGYSYGYPYSYSGYNGWPDIETNYEIRGGSVPAIEDLSSTSGQPRLRPTSGQQLSWENVGYDPQYGKNLHWDTLPGDAWTGPTSGDYQGPNPSVMWARKQNGAKAKEGGRAAMKQGAKPAASLKQAHTEILRPGFFQEPADVIMGEPGGRPEPTEQELPRCPCAGVGGMCLDYLRDEIHDQGPSPCWCDC